MLRKFMSNGILLVVIADLHINSTIALRPPVINLDDGDTSHASRSQHWLWECWLHFWKYIKDKAKKRRVICILNGDLGELDTKRRSNQIITPNKSIIKSLCIETLEPAMDVVSSWIFIRGTPAHEGKSAWLEEDIAKDTKTAFRYSENVASWWHFQQMIDGLRIDAAHHASNGGRPYNKGMSAIRLASDVVWHYRVEKDILPPDIVFRSHSHFTSDSGNNIKGTRAFFTPCWSLITEYGYRIGKENSYPDIGGYIFDCKDGKYDWELQLYEPEEIKNIWKINLK